MNKFKQFWKTKKAVVSFKVGDKVAPDWDKKGSYTVVKVFSDTDEFLIREEISGKETVVDDADLIGDIDLEGEPEFID